MQHCSQKYYLVLQVSYSKVSALAKALNAILKNEIMNTLPDYYLMKLFSLSSCRSTGGFIKLDLKVTCSASDYVLDLIQNFKVSKP